ncbi:hypothetical protein Droror1_Dr00001600 [Drosera rotundifolia]
MLLVIQISYRCRLLLLWLLIPTSPAMGERSSWSRSEMQLLRDPIQQVWRTLQLLDELKHRSTAPSSSMHDLSRLGPRSCKGCLARTLPGQVNIRSTVTQHDPSAIEDNYLGDKTVHIDRGHTFLYSSLQMYQSTVYNVYSSTFNAQCKVL